MATERKRKSDKPEEGVTYYFAPGGFEYKSPKINADEIAKIIENKVIDEGLTKQQRILFQHDIKVSVFDTKKKEVDADLTAALEDMTADVSIDFALQRAWRDTAEWGPALINPVWDYEGSEFRLLKLKRLPPESFADLGPTVTYVYNRILPGVSINDKTGQVEYWQRDSKGIMHQLTNVEMLTDPVKAQLGGSPAILPVFPYVKMLTHSWMRQMQKVNIYGSGGIWFLKVDDPTGDDKKFAQNLVNNVSSTNRYQLRPNMSIENLGVTESGSALETITQLGMEIRQFFTPAGLIQKEGGNTLIGGSSGPEFELYMSFIAGTHRWLESFAHRLLKPWLVYNGYQEKGFRIVVDIPEPTIDRSETYIKIHDSGSDRGSLLPNEKRALLRASLPQSAGIDISDLDDTGLAELDAYNMKSNPQAVTAQMAKLNAIKDAFGANKLDPTYVLGKAGTDKARKLYQATLGIEEGE